MDLYQKIDALAAATHDEYAANLKRDAEIQEFGLELRNVALALGRLVDGLGGALGVSFEESAVKVKKK